MSGPPPPLPSDLRDLLGAERDFTEPPGVKDRVLRRIEARLPIDGVPGVNSRPRSRWHKWLARLGVGGASGIARFAFAFASGSAVTLAATQVVEHAKEVRRARQVEVQRHGGPARGVPMDETQPAEPPVPAPAVPVPAPSTEPSPLRGSAEHRHPSGKGHGGRESSLGPPKNTHAGIAVEERTLLEDARAALQRGDTTAALEMLTAHRERFPASGLSEERDALLVREAVRAGSYGEAREWLRAFREHYPESPLLPVLESAVKDARDSQDKP
jgi:hypothetical protein